MVPVEVVRSMGAALDRGKGAAPCRTGSGIVGRLLVGCSGLAPLRQHNGSGGRCVGIVQGCVGHAAPANPTILRGALRIFLARKTPRGIPQYRGGPNLTQRSSHADFGGHSDVVAGAVSHPGGVTGAVAPSSRSMELAQVESALSPREWQTSRAVCTPPVNGDRANFASASTNSVPNEPSRCSAPTWQKMDYVIAQ